MSSLRGREPKYNCRFGKTIFTQVIYHIIRRIASGNYFPEDTKLYPTAIPVDKTENIKTLQKMRVLPPQQILNLYKIKQFRNELCHNLLTPETINKLRTGCINIIDEITEIRAEMIKKIPEGTIKNYIIEYKYDNGKIVKVNKDTLEIISVTEPKMDQLSFFINRRHNHK